MRFTLLAIGFLPLCIFASPLQSSLAARDGDCGDNLPQASEVKALLDEVCSFDPNTELTKAEPKHESPETYYVAKDMLTLNYKIEMVDINDNIENQEDLLYAPSANCKGYYTNVIEENSCGRQAGNKWITYFKGGSYKSNDKNGFHLKFTIDVNEA